MNTSWLTTNRCDATPWGMKKRLLPMSALLLLAGCISVRAPDKPIEINLNINVKQEVVVSLKKDAEDFITNNPELFPK
jgi:hypothetical protein